MIKGKNKTRKLKDYFGILFLFCLSIKAQAEMFPEMKPDSVKKHKGFILRQTVLGKDQKSVSYYDYFFLPSDSGSAGMFIKVKEGNVSREVLDTLVKKENETLWKSGEVEITARLKEGKWDDPDFRSNVNLTMDPRRQGVYFILIAVNPVNKQSSQEYSGIIVKSQQVNKAGRKLKTYDYFFKTDGKEYFVKSSSNTIPRAEIESTLKRKIPAGEESEVINIKGEIKEGLWDTDDPRQQSRIGKYILIYEIIGQ